MPAFLPSVSAATGFNVCGPPSLDLCKVFSCGSSLIEAQGDALGDSRIIFYIGLGGYRILGHCLFYTRVAYRSLALPGS